MKLPLTPLQSRSLFAFGLGCSLAVLPLCSAPAQDAEKAPTATTTPMPSDPGTVPPTNSPDKMEKPVSPKHVKDTLTLKEKMFMRKAAGGNLAEVQMAQLALKNGENAQVKEFAQKMIDDHGQANKDLETLAQDKGLLNFKPELTEENKALYAQMGAMNGSAFDTAYIKHAVSDHETDVKEYKMADQAVKDTDLKGYVDKTLPIIEGHLQMAKEMNATKTKAVNS